MAMRITTKMMQSTSLRNLNTNKYRQEKLTNQMSTGKKISRPSDDPVIAIRSLKLNSSLDKIDQYYEKNVSDAQSWLELTESALHTVNEILSMDIRPNIVQACSSYMNSEDREAIITNLKNAMAEIYSTGNASSAGRSLFTGYRTDMPLTMKEDKQEKNRITEQFYNDSLDDITFVYAGDIKTINEGNFKEVADITKDDISSNKIYRKRLAYGDVDINEDGTAAVEIGYVMQTDKTGNTHTPGTSSDAAKFTVEDRLINVYIDTTKIPNEAVFDVYDSTSSTDNFTTITVKKGDTGIASGVGGVTLSYDQDGTLKISNNNPEPPEALVLGTNVTYDTNGRSKVNFDDQCMHTFEIENMFATANNDAYMSVAGEENTNKISFVASTGEILFGEEIAKKLMGLSAETELRITYDKTNWKENDIDPVHYFYTERDSKTASGKEKTLEFNETFLADPSQNGRQIIEYDVGNNQSLRVNTTANEAFSHAMGRDVEEVISMLEEYDSYQESFNEVEKMIESKKYEGTEDQLKLERQKEALQEAMTRVGDKINKRCQALIKDCDGFFEQVQLAETDCGTRLSKLELTENRLSMQQTNYGELVSENEDADYTDLVIQLKSIEMTYEAALSSISYVMQTSLLDFIR